jgi:hypothetical protein
MAQYLPYIPETIPEPALYKPDFNFFDRMLQRKQSMFEQGLSRVRSAYSSVLNAPLSNKNNIPLRDQYIKNAQEQLTKLSSSDLSLMENVSAAESIYAPFWQDKFIVQDAAITKGYQAEMQKLMSWKDSPKLEEREKYNSISMMYLQNGLSKLQNADRTPEAFGAVEMRKAEPFTNIEAYLHKMATAEKLEIKYDSPDGPYLIETKNGQRSEKKYAVWAASKIGNNFQGQFDVIGTVENEERVKILKRNNPNLTETEIQSLIAKDVVSELNQGYTKRTQEADVEIARIDSLLGSIGQTNDPQHEQMFKKLKLERDELVARKASINQEYTYFDQGKDKVLNYVTSAPKQYFSVLAKQRLINNFAIGMASIDQKTIKENTGFTAAQTYELEKAKFNLSVMKADRDYEQQIWERMNPKTTGTGTGTGTGSDPNNPVVPGVDATGALTYAGKSGTSIERTAAEVMDIFNKEQEERFTNGHNLLFTQDGLLGLAKNLDLTPGEIADIATAFQSEIATKYEHKFTNDQAKASNKLTDKLLADPAVKAAGITKITGPGTMKNALIAYSTDYFSTKIKNNIPFTDQEKIAQKSMIAAVQDLDKYNALEKQRKELIKTNLLTNKNLNHLTVDRGGGEKDLVTIGDLEKKFKATKFEDEDGKQVTLTAKDLATAYMSGNLSEYRPSGWQLAGLRNSTSFYTGQTVKINGKEYSSYGLYTPMMGIGPDRKDYPVGLETLKTTVADLDKVYGSSKKLSTDIVSANNSIVPNLLDYKNLTGVQSKEFRLNFKPNVTMASGDNATRAVYEGTQPGNVKMVYDVNGQRVSDDHILAINTLLKSEKNIEEYVTAEYLPDAKYGKTLRITLSKVRDDEGKDGKIADLPISDLKTQYNFALKEGTGTYLDDLYKSPNFQIFQSILRGEEFKTDPMLKAAGFEASITPNVKGAGSNPTFVTVTTNYKERVNEIDKNTGQFVSYLKDKSDSFKLNLVGDTAKSPDEIVNSVYDGLYRQIEQNHQLEKQYNIYLEKMKKSGTGTWDAKVALQEAGLGHLIK